MTGAYLKYFLFLSANWNTKVASHIIKNEVAGEKKYKIKTTGADELKSLEKKGIDISNATLYMPASYDVLDLVFQQLKPLSNSHFIDIGCGKGRALCVAAHNGFRKLTGIDFYPALCRQAEANLEITKPQVSKLEYKVICNDAFFYEIPTDADHIFMFNPFNEIIMSGVVENILKSQKKKPRKITLIYLNTTHKNLFTNAGFKETWRFQKMKYLEAGIFELK